MKIIEQVHIQYYRSLKDCKIKNLNQLNIFSGKNDVGKSNILKALDLFFNKTKTNFFEDFNKERLRDARQRSVKAKQYIKIQITFLNPGNYKVLPAKFTVSKSWDRLGNLIGVTKDNLELLKKRKNSPIKSINTSRRILNGFLNKIRYTYVPAIRDENFFFHLLDLLQKTLFDNTKTNESTEFNDTLSTFNEHIGNITKQLKSEFQQVSGIESSLSFPTEISELFQRLIIDTKSDGHDIPLKLRGDGIRLRYIPTILNHIALKSKNFEIWGFDEPENSCEHGLAKELSDNFQTTYLNEAQIFIATHSFNFISIESECTSKYRVYKKEKEFNSEVLEINKKNEELLHEDIGLIQINEALAEVYNKYSQEIKIAQDTKKSIRKYERPYLIFEGKTDNKLFSAAYKALRNKNIDETFHLNVHDNYGNGDIGSGAPNISRFLKNHITKFPTENVVIGIFDFDEEGINQLNSLKNQYNKIDVEGFDNVLIYQNKNNPKIFGISLVTPSFRENFTNLQESKYCYLSVELLFQDNLITNPNKFFVTRFSKTVFTFTGNKQKFTEKIIKKVRSQDIIDFSGFQSTINLLETLAAYSTE